jgi:hypothetical protein
MSTEEVKSIAGNEDAEKKAKPVKSCGERIFAKILEMEAAISILKGELYSLSPQELAKFQSLKEDNTNKKENLSTLQKRLIKIVKDGDEKFIRALFSVANSLKLVNEKD